MIGNYGDSISRQPDQNSPSFYYQKIETTFSKRPQPSTVKELVKFSLQDKEEKYAKHIIRAGIVLTIIPLAMICLAKKFEFESIKKLWHGQVKVTLTSKMSDPNKIKDLFRKMHYEEVSFGKRSGFSDLIDATGLNPEGVHKNLRLLHLKKDENALHTFVGLLSDEQLKNLHAAAIPYLDVTKLSETQLELLFALAHPITENDTAPGANSAWRRLTLLTGEQLNTLLPKLSSAQLVAALSFVYPHDKTTEVLKKAGPEVKEELERIQTLDFTQLSDAQAQSYIDLLENTDTNNERVRLFAALTPDQRTTLQGKVTLEDLRATPEEIDDFGLGGDPSLYLTGGEAPALREDKKKQLIEKFNNYGTTVDLPQQKSFADSFRKLNVAQTEVFNEFISDSDQIEPEKKPVLLEMISKSQNRDTPKNFLIGYPSVVKPDERGRLIALLNSYNTTHIGPQSAPMQRFLNGVKDLSVEQLGSLTTFVKGSQGLNKEKLIVLTQVLDHSSTEDKQPLVKDMENENVVVIEEDKNIEEIEILTEVEQPLDLIQEKKFVGSGDKGLDEKPLTIAQAQGKRRKEIEKERDALLLRHKTKGDGSCGLHALFDEKRIIEGVLTYQCDAQKKREEFCDWLNKLYAPDSYDRGKNLPRVIRDHLISFLANPANLSSDTYKTLSKAIGIYYTRHRPDTKNVLTDEQSINFIQDKEMFDAYLTYLKNPEVDLYLEELEAAAICFDKTIDLVQPDTFSTDKKTFAKTYNPGHPVVTIWFNGQNHYERAERRITPPGGNLKEKELLKEVQVEPKTTAPIKIKKSPQWKPLKPGDVRTTEKEALSPLIEKSPEKLQEELVKAERDYTNARQTLIDLGRENKIIENQLFQAEGKVAIFTKALSGDKLPSKDALQKTIATNIKDYIEKDRACFAAQSDLIKLLKTLPPQKRIEMLQDLVRTSTRDVLIAQREKAEALPEKLKHEQEKLGHLEEQITAKFPSKIEEYKELAKLESANDYWANEGAERQAETKKLQIRLDDIKKI